MTVFLGGHAIQFIQGRRIIAARQSSGHIAPDAFEQGVHLVRILDDNQKPRLILDVVGISQDQRDRIDTWHGVGVTQSGCGIADRHIVAATVQGTFFKYNVPAVGKSSTNIVLLLRQRVCDYPKAFSGT